MTTKISWTDETWQPILGCSVVSTGCEHCYAMSLASSRLKNHELYAGLTNHHRKWTGEVRFVPGAVNTPLSWRKPRRVFVCSMADLFHENVKTEWLVEIFTTMALASRHQFQVLTKRPERMREFFSDMAARAEIDGLVSDVRDCTPAVEGEPLGPPSWPLPNVWLGVSAENQRYAEERIPTLLRTPAAIRFVSLEPLLGPIDLRKLRIGAGLWVDALTGFHTMQNFPGIGRPQMPAKLPGLDWIIVGGESGRNARPMHPAWVQDLLEQNQIIRVPFHFKQWGAWYPISLHERFKRGGQWAKAMGSIIAPDGRNHLKERVEAYYREYGELPDMRNFLNAPGAEPTDDRLNRYGPMYELAQPGRVEMAFVGSKLAGRELGGRVWNEYPATA